MKRIPLFFRRGITSWTLSALLVAVALFTGSPVHAQNKGISSDGRDYYVGYMPSVPHPGEYANVPYNSYIIVGSFADNNMVTISYFDESGNEIQGAQTQIQKGRTHSFPIDPGHMNPTRPGEIFEFKSAHVTSRYPVSVQVYEEGPSNGGLYSAIPTNALGKSYVAECFFDTPKEDVPTGALYEDSSSSEFMIIAAYDDTHVTYTPNATTYAGIVGVNSGDHATGAQHPRLITLRRGETFWVRSVPNSSNNDLTGSTINADKPVAVISGQERALLGDPGGLISQYSDIRDVLVEQMTPVESWDFEYPSIPFLPSQEANTASSNGSGDMYRAVTSENSPGVMGMWDGTLDYTRTVGPYQNPAAQWDNIENPVNFRVETTNPDGSLKKMNIAQYDYFQGDGSQDVTTYTVPNEMNIIALSRYRTASVFQVPKNSNYKGAQFINVITNKDSLSKINVMVNGNNPKTLTNFPAVKTYAIPFHPELKGYTYRLAAGDYMLWGNTPFACYSYGRTEATIKLNAWGYAAPTGQFYGSRDEASAPRIEITPYCDRWDVRVTETQKGDVGLSEVTLLNDPDALITHPAYVSYNVSLSPQTPVFIPGDSATSFSIHINDITKDAFAAIYAVDKAGNDTVYQFHFKGQAFTLSSASHDFGPQTLGDNVCSSFTLKINGTGSADTMTVEKPSFMLGDGNFTVSTVPTLPAVVRKGDSVVFNVCFKAPDLQIHYDSLVFAVGCFDLNHVDSGSGKTPLIDATDWDFKIVPVGSTVHHMIHVSNIGKGDLVIDQNWVLHNLTGEFGFGDAAKLPITITPGNGVDLDFTFQPTQTGPAFARQDWGTNIKPPFEHQKKDTSALRGFGVKPGLTWDRPNQGFTVVCDSSQIVRVNLLNPDPTHTGKKVNVTDVRITGPDASEFSVVGDQAGYMPFDGKVWPLDTNGVEYVDLMFKPDLSKQYATRSATITATGVDVDPTSIVLSATIRHASMTIDPPSWDFGVQLPGATFTKTFMLHNIGDTDLIIQDFPGLSGQYTILSGPLPGDHVKPGDSVAIVVQAVAPRKGESLANDTMTSATPACTPSRSIIAKIDGASVSVEATDHAFNLVYECMSGTGNVFGMNTGTQGVFLDSVKIENGLGANDADEFAFDDKTQAKYNTTNIKGGDTTPPFHVVFTPTRDLNATAEIVFYFRDTTVIPNAVLPIKRQLTGIGYKAQNVMSLHKDYGNQAYTALTKEYFTVPVQLKQTFDANANIYGVHFTIRYLRDQFIFDPSRTDFGGLASSGPATPVADPTDNNYELITFDLSSPTPILSLDTVAHLSWQYVVAKDSSTLFELRDLAFLDKTGATACWVKGDVIPGQFYGTNECGDYTLRHFLKDNNLNFEVDKVSPNPMAYLSRIQYTVKVAGIPMSIDVVNSLGEQVAKLVDGEIEHAGRYEVRFDARDIPAGVYTVRFTTPGDIATKTIVIQK